MGGLHLFNTNKSFSLNIFNEPQAGEMVVGFMDTGKGNYGSPRVLDRHHYVSRQDSRNCSLK